jgi:hypothetical protein
MNEKIKKILNIIRVLAIYVFIGLSFMPMINSSIVNQYLVRPVDYLEPIADWVSLTSHQELLGKYYQYSLPIIRYGNKLGLGTTWKMYSPSQKEIEWLDWQVQDPTSKWHSLALPNSSPEYFNTRSWFGRQFIDNKRPIISVRLYRRIFQKAFAGYLCQTMKDEFGWQPQAVKIVRYGQDIPLPQQRGDWQPARAEATTSWGLGEYKCSYLDT